jgi:hypothetical protein
MECDPQVYQKVRAHLLHTLEVEEAIRLWHGPAWQKAKALIGDAISFAQFHSDLLEMPGKWPADMVSCLGQIASSATEDVRVRCCAVRMIHRCMLGQFADQLGVMLAEYRQHQTFGDSIVRALAALGGRKHMLGIKRAAGECHWFVDDCIVEMYRMLFDDNGRPPGAYRRDALAWWENARPCEEQLQEWAKGQNLPADDGLGNPGRSD